MAKNSGAAFTPQTTGIFVLLVIILAFLAGVVRGELVLFLLGAIFLAVWLYCLTATVLTALIQRGRARNFSIRVTPREVTSGGFVRVEFADNGADFRLPGVLVRCRLLLRTGDGRKITRDFDPAPRRWRRTDAQARQEPRIETLEASERGAYFSLYDEFAIFDAPGFFRFAYRIRQGTQARLFVCPLPAEEALPPPAYSGGTERPRELRQRRSDSFIDHRPYIPGDDPRRINWKLFGHGGELFVREGEPQPPPHSNILILIDSQYDTMLYSAEHARRGVDLLCENALALALECAESGMNVRVGFSPGTGQVNAGEKNSAYLEANTPAELPAIFACPAALPWYPLKSGAQRQDAQLPAPPPDARGMVVFALPRASAEASALSRFLSLRPRNSENGITPVEIIFLYSGGGAALDEAAEICASFYNQKPGVRARQMKTGEQYV